MTNINKTSLEDSLRKKGAIKADKVIEHEALLKDRELFNSLTYLENDLLRYLRTKAEIVEAYQKNKDWEEVLNTVVYSDIPDSNEAFVEYVEEVYSVEVKTPKQLEELIVTTVDWIGDVFIEAMDSKYSRALKYAIENGAKYKDLLLIEPKDFNLPERWKTWREKDKYRSILWAIEMTFSLSEAPGLMMLPTPRAVAEELEAPYSVIMDSYKSFNVMKTIGNEEEELFNRLREAVRTYIKSQPKAWRDEMLFNPNGKTWTKEDAKRTEEMYIDGFIIWFRTLLYKELLPEEPPTEREAKIIEYHKETIYKHFKSYLDEAKDIYNKHQDKAKIKALKKAIGYYYLIP